MAKKLNKNVATGVIVAAAALMSGAGFVVVANLPGQDPRVYADKAEAAEHEGDQRRAAALFLRAASKDVNGGADFIVKAARCLLQEGEIGDAIRLAGDAQVKDPRLKSAQELALEIQYEVVKVWRVTAQWNRVLEHARKLLDLDAQSFLGNLAHGRACLALVTENEGYWAEGEAALKRALELDPTNPEAVESNVQRLLTDPGRADRRTRTTTLEERREEARRLVAAAVAKSEESGDKERTDTLRVIAAQLELRSGDPTRVAKGVEQLRALVEGGTKALAAYIELGNHYLVSSGSLKGDAKNEAFDQGEKCFNKAIEVDPGAAQAYWALGQFYQYRIRKDQEYEAYRKGLEAVPYKKHFRSLLSNHYRILMISELCLGEVYRASASTGEKKESALAAAESWLATLQKEVAPESVELLTLRAYLSNARGDYKRATREIESADRKQPGHRNHRIKLLMGELYVRQQEWGSARRALEEAISIESGIPRLYVLLAQVYLKLGQPADVIKTLRPDFAGSGPLQEYLAQDLTAIELRMLAYQEMKQFDLAAAENKKLTQARGDTSEGRLREASLLLVEEKFTEAESVLKELLGQDDVMDGALRGLVYLYEKTNRRPDGLKLLDELAAKQPDNKLIKELYASLSRDPNKPLDEAQVMQLMGDVDPVIRGLNMSAFHAGRGEWTKAAECLDAVEKERPSDPQVVERQFVMALRNQDWERAKTYAEKFGAINVDGTGSRTAYGRLAIAKQEWDQAIQLLNLALSPDQGFPNYSMGWTFLAEAYAGAGKLYDAKLALLRALEIDPTNGFANRMMAQVAGQEGDAAAEEKYLRAAARALPGDPEIQRQMAILDEKKDPAAGIAKRERIRAEDPKNVDNLLRLARLYRQVQKYGPAAEAFTEALRASKNNLQVARELAGFYAMKEVNRPQEGERLLTELMQAQEQLSNKALAAMFLGFFYEGQGQISKAGTLFKTAVEFDPTPDILSRAAEFFVRTSNVPAAIDCYRQVLKQNAPANALRTAQSRLIALLLAQKELDAAFKETEDYIRRYPDDPQGRVYLGTFHMQGGDIAKAEQAFSLELESRPDNAIALWQRGQLYCLKGEWAAAVEDLKKAKKYREDGFDFYHRIALADALIELGKGDEALIELKAVLSANPKALHVAKALADAYIRVRPPRIAEAEQLVVQYMRENPKQEDWPLLLGRLGELSKNHARAIEAYEKAAEVSQFRPVVLERLFQAFRAAKRPADILRYSEEKLSLNRVAEAPLALATVGWAYAEVGREADAFATYEKALSAAQVSLETYNRVMADLVARFGDAKVLAWARQQAERHPSSVQYQKNLLHLLFLNRKDDDAIATADAIIRNAAHKADLIFAHMGRAAFLDRAGKLDEARKCYEDVLKTEPDCVPALNNLAYMLVDRMNRPEEALVYSQRAAKLAPRNGDVLDTHGWVLAQSKRYGEAITMFLRALEQDRRQPTINFHLGWVYLQRKDRREALRRLNDAKTFALEIPNYPDLPMIEEALRQAEALSP